MRILYESEVPADLGGLEEAWRSEPTFAFLPDRSGISATWLDESLASLPGPLQRRHFLLLTSGSTGLPKLVVGSRERAECLAKLMHHAQNGEAVAQTVLALPLTYCYALVNQFVWARCHGRALVPTRGLAQPDVLRAALEAARDAMLCLVGAQVSLLARHFESAAFPGVIRVHFAGGRFPQERLPTVRRLFPHAEIFNNYGCAEAMPRITVRRAEDADDAADIGLPLPGVELRIGADGQIEFRSAYGAVAYVDGEGFHPISDETWVGTGDAGECGPDGRWRLLGRGGEVFKRHGEKVSSALVLATVNARWAGDAALYRERDAEGEEGHVLVLAPSPSSDEVRSVLRGFREHHPRAHWPLRIESFDSLPVLGNGKVDQISLPRGEGKVVRWRQRI